MKNRILFMMLGITGIFITACHMISHPIQLEYMTEPCLIPTKDNKFRLCDNMIVHIDNEYHAVPMGFKTDLASIPRIMWPVFAPSDYDCIAPAVLHDWHYCCSNEVHRKRADDIFYYALIEHGMNRVKAYIYYLAVRALGKKYYQYGVGIYRHEGEFAKEELQGVYKDVNYGLG
ncbi:TPA: DUF1353 domain-containing protein [Legionella pneumophila]|nr:DUF1353 domain-containing protein [Legionella pneumophila]